MKRYFIIWVEAFKQSLKSMLAYRADFLFSLITMPFTVIAGYVAIFVAARQTLIADWDMSSLIILGGLHLTLSGLEQALIEPNLQFFSDRIISGELDELLLKPIKALFSVSLMKQSPSELIQAIAGFGVLLYGMVAHGTPITGWLILLPGILISLIFIWSMRMVLAEMALFIKGCDLTVIYSSVWQFLKYPSGIYPAILRAVMLAIPFTLICMPTATAVSGDGFMLILVEAGVTTLYFMLTVILWKMGIKHYTSASN